MSNEKGHGLKGPCKEKLGVKRGIGYVSEFFETSWIGLYHVNYEGSRRQKDTVVAIGQKVFSLGDKMVREIRDLFDDA